jgi:hypothetical protein
LSRRGAKAEDLKLGLQIQLRQAIAARARTATLQQVIGQEANVPTKGRVVNGFRGLLGVRLGPQDILLRLGAKQ